MRKDAVSAVMWLRKAAERNEPSAQFNLGIMYKEGRVIGFSIQETGLPPGFKAPVVFAVVAVGPVRLFTIIGGDPANIEIGLAVQLEPLRVADMPSSILPVRLRPLPGRVR